MEDSKHIVRVFLLLALAIIAFAGVRAIYIEVFLTPEEFGKYGPYRYSNVAEQMNLEVRLRSPQACAECHDDVAATWSAGTHSAVVCENCHAPYVEHVRDDDRYAAMPIYKSYELCMRCHRELEARRADFPQQNIVRHLAELGRDLQPGACFDCHGPHDPTPRQEEPKAAAEPGNAE